MSLRYSMPIGPVSCGIAQTSPLGPLTCAHVQSTNLSFSAAAPYGRRSSRLSVMVKVGMYWNSICATSGAPVPACSAVRSLVYCRAALTGVDHLDLDRPGTSCSNSATSCAMSGTQVQNVSSVGVVHRLVDVGLAHRRGGGGTAALAVAAARGQRGTQRHRSGRGEQGSAAYRELWGRCGHGELPSKGQRGPARRATACWGQGVSREVRVRAGATAARQRRPVRASGDVPP